VQSRPNNSLLYCNLTAVSFLLPTNRDVGVALKYMFKVLQQTIGVGGSYRFPAQLDKLPQIASSISAYFSILESTSPASNGTLNFPLMRSPAQHTSNVTRHTSQVSHTTSHVTRHTSHVTCHTSHVTRHTSHVTRHTSHVTRHTSLTAASQHREEAPCNHVVIFEMFVT
jgi:hypothetical protein